MDELLQEVQAEQEYVLDTFRALNEELQRKEITFVELAAISTFPLHKLHKSQIAPPIPIIQKNSYPPTPRGGQPSLEFL